MLFLFLEVVVVVVGLVNASPRLRSRFRSDCGSRTCMHACQKSAKARMRLTFLPYRLSATNHSRNSRDNEYQTIATVSRPNRCLIETTTVVARLATCQSGTPRT